MAEQGKERVRVVVVGMGAVTAFGSSLAALWNGAKEGRVAIRPVQRIPMEPYRTRIAAEIQEPIVPKHDYGPPEGFRDPVIDFAIKAAEEAVESSGLSTEQIPAERWAVVVGTCNAGLLSGERWYLDKMAGKTPDPRLLMYVPPQALAEAVGGAFGLKGSILSINTACSAGANAIGYAADIIRNGQADVALTGGSDALSDVLIAGFNSLESLSPKPAAPYSRDREGLSLGEGSGMLVLIREDLAEQLGVPILAEVLGYGVSSDGYHPTAPHPEGIGAARAIQAALSNAGVTAAQVGYVNSHGTGTSKNDPAETRATRLGLGEAAYHAVVSSTKSMIGHLLGAAGAAEAIVTIKALQEQIAPPTANFTEPDPDCDLDYVPNTARPLAIDVAMSNNFAFGGANASLVFAKPGTQSAPPVPNRDRVVVTGVATLTSAGNTPADVWTAFADERATTQIENGVRIGRVQLDPSPFLSARERRRMDRLGILGVVSCKLALRDAGIEIGDDNRTRIGVIFGTGVGPMESMEQFSRPLFEEDPTAANPGVFPNTVYNAGAGQVSILLGTVGVTSTVTAGHAAGASSLCYAYDLIAADQADAILCPAVDTLTDTVIRAYQELGFLGADQQATTESSFALAEGGVTLVLERLSKAQARGAHIYGEVLGYGIAADGLGAGRWDEHGHGLERAMRLALENAGLEPTAIKAIWASATGYEPGDAPEEEAIRRVFSEQTHIITPKRLLGEPMGVGGSLNAALALTGWQRQATDVAPSGPILVNSCSLGGTYFSIVLAPIEA